MYVQLEKVLLSALLFSFFFPWDAGFFSIYFLENANEDHKHSKKIEKHNTHK